VLTCRAKYALVGERVLEEGLQERWGSEFEGCGVGRASSVYVPTAGTPRGNTGGDRAGLTLHSRQMQNCTQPNQANTMHHIHQPSCAASSACTR